MLAFPQRARWSEKVAQIAKIWRRYDLAIAAIPSDRARIFAWAAAKKAVGFTTAHEASWLKQHLLDIAIPFDNLHTHTVTMGLALVRALGIPPIAKIQPPRVSVDKWHKRKVELGLQKIEHYAVIHPNPKFRYKMWDSAKWIELISSLRNQNMDVILTGSADADEAAYVQDIAVNVPEGCLCLVGQLSLAETAEILKHARLFVGPDTAVTHLAAATGIPTLALFGPSNPVKWGPWPKNYSTDTSPWPKVGSSQLGNVYLMQGPGKCVPCLLEGCDRHLNSISRCLQEITANQVIVIAKFLLTQNKTAQSGNTQTSRNF